MKALSCPCGEQVTGATDEELISNVNAHIDSKHPEMRGQYSDEQILSRAEEV